MLLVVQTIVAIVGFAMMFRAARDIANTRRVIFMLLRKEYGEIERELREIDRRR